MRPYPLFKFALHRHQFGGESPLRVQLGSKWPESLAKSKGVVVRQGLKEAGGKIAGLRTETAYKACMMDESAQKDEIRSWVMYVDAEAICEEGQCS